MIRKKGNPTGFFFLCYTIIIGTYLYFAECKVSNGIGVDTIKYVEKMQAEKGLQIQSGSGQMYESPFILKPCNSTFSEEVFFSKSPFRFLIFSFFVEPTNEN